MPYLTETDFNAPSGELNRAITKAYLSIPMDLLESALSAIVAKYMHDQKPRYATFNDIVGALVCAGMEHTRRRPDSENDLEIRVITTKVIKALYKDTVAPYEDKKIAEHGDIYGSF